MTPARGREGLGRQGEELALDHLRHQGYRILARDLRIGRQQIDILAREGGQPVVVEVKTRRHPGRPAEGFNPKQARRLLEAGRRHFPEGEGMPRLDLVTVSLHEDRPAEIHLYRDLKIFG